MTVALRGDWAIEERGGTARVLHEPWPEPARRSRRTVALCSVSDRAVVLGSTQPSDVVDGRRAAGAGVDVVHRRSGGGAVLVAPGAQVWLDAWIPRDDALWDDDVLRSSWWLGETWLRALLALGAADLEVHRGRVATGPWSSLVCFAAVGPGEVTAGAAKLVGVAQRRDRHGARLHSMAPLRWRPADLVALLRTPTSVYDDELGAAAVGLCDVLPSLDETGSELRRVVDALVAALP